MFSVGMGNVLPQPWMRRRCSIFALWDLDHVCDSAVLSWNVGNHKPPWEVLSLVSDLHRINSNSELTAQHAWNCSTDVLTLSRMTWVTHTRCHMQQPGSCCSWQATKNVLCSDGASLEECGFKSQENHFRGQADVAAMCQRKKVTLRRRRSRCGKKWTKYFAGTWKLGCPSESSWKRVKDVAGVSCWADFRRWYHAEFLCRNRLGCCFMKPISCTRPETSRWCR